MALFRVSNAEALCRLIDCRPGARAGSFTFPHAPSLMIVAIYNECVVPIPAIVRHTASVFPALARESDKI